MELASEKSYKVSSIMDEIADEDSFAKTTLGGLKKNLKNLFPDLWPEIIVLVQKLVML